MNRFVLLSKPSPVACLLALTTSLWLAPGCKGSGVVGTVGVPNVEFGGEGIGAQVESTIKNPCEIDLDFGNVPIGETESATVKIDNTGSGFLDLSPVNPNLNAEFGLTLPASNSAGPGSVLELSVTFQPYQATQVSSTLTIQTDGINSTCPTPNQVTVQMTGVGIQLSLLVQPSSVDFGYTIVNTAETKSVMLVNKSDGPIDDISAILTGVDSNFFTVLDAPTSLPANGSAVVHISYAPLAVETRSLASVIFEGADGERTTLGLFGEPLATALYLPTAPINFGYVQLQSTVTECTTATNQANVPVTIKGLTSFATPGGAFALATTDDATPPNPFSLPITLQTGQTAKVCFSFTPPITQQFQGQATLVTDDPSGTDPVVKLTGWGGGPQITCTPSSLAFGETLDQSLSTLSVVCTNTGTTLPGVKLTMSPPKASPFAFTAEFDNNTDPYILGGLAPGQSTQIDVNFAPTTAATQKGTLFVESNGGQGQTLQIPLTGQGLDIPPCQYTLTPSTLNFGNVQVSSTSPVLSYEIQNVGSNTCLVQGIGIKNDATGAFHVVTTSITPDPQTGKVAIPAPGPGVISNLVVSLDFQPTAASPGLSAEATFSVSDPSAPNQVLELIGSSESACLVVAPTTLNFGNVGVDAAGAFCTSQNRTFSVFNQCSTTDTLVSLALQSGPGDTIQQFSTPVGPSLPAIVSAGTPDVYETVFQPSSLGTHTAQFLVSDGTLDTLLSMQGTAVSAATETDTFTIQPPEADILWILDDDDYGEDEQSAVASQLPGFFKAGAGVDYRMAMTTDNDSTSSTTAEFGRLLPCAGCSIAGTVPTIISPSSVPPGGKAPDPATAFADLWTSVNTQVYQGVEDQFFISLYNALQRLPQPGVDFLRPGAYFASITDSEYSDGDESSEEPGGHDPGWYQNYFQSYFPNPLLFSYNFITETYPSNGTGFSTTLPPDIQHMVTALNGLAFNTEDPNWGNVFPQVWNPVIAASGFHTLTGSPSEGQTGISVSVNGVTLDQQDGTGNTNWTYQSTLNAIVFNLNNNPPKVGATVSVTYPIGCK